MSDHPLITGLGDIEAEGLKALEAVADQAALDAWKSAFIGGSGKVKAAFGALREVPKDIKPAYGQRLNALRSTLEGAFEARKASFDALAKASARTIDMTEPGMVHTRHVARRHILMRVREELVEVFARMGFEVATGPELEDDAHNFAKLNIPPGHPARDPIDNFYVDDPATNPAPRMLRSQTSTVQIRTLEKAVADGGGALKKPVKIISPGRVYRPDTVDATHSFMFHQIEGLYVDRRVTMADLKTTLMQFARAYFGEDSQIRLRPSFFPFTEPSAELDMMIRLRPDQPARWIELGGCGMVDPAVFQACGIDPDQWTGFAFGFGIERIAMGRYGIPDIRMLFENDARFLSQL